MLGPTTTAVEKRGSSTVNATSSRSTCSASDRVRVSHSPGPSAASSADAMPSVVDEGDGRDAGQHPALEQLEAGTAAGGDVRDAVGQPELRDRRHRVAA